MVFRRRNVSKPADPRPAVARFWQWWAEHRDEVLAAVDANRPDDVRALLEPAVTAVDNGLTWEMTAGSQRRHALTLSAGRDTERRAVAERWMLAAPDDPDIEFAAARAPRPLDEVPAINVDDYDIDLGELVAGTGVDPRRTVLDVVVHHPLFPLLGEKARDEVAWRGLVAALGDDDVLRWIGTVTVSADRPVDAIALSMLGAVADQLRPAQGPWVTLHGAGRGGRPVTAVARRPLLRVERPLADTSVMVTLGYKANRNGEPEDESVPADAERLQEQVLAALGGDGPHALRVGHLIGGGRVVAYFYVDGLEVDVESIEPVLRSWTHGTAAARDRFDPAWDEVSPLRT